MRQKGRMFRLGEKWVFLNPIYTPKRTKLKGYEKQRGSFNKKRRAQK